LSFHKVNNINTEGGGIMALIAHWPLNGNTNDISGNGYNGTPTNITYVAGKIGQAASFNGTTSVVDLSSFTTPNSDFTVSAWVKITTGGVFQHIVDGQNTSATEWHLAILNTNKPYFSYGSNNYHQSAATLDLNKWYHLVGVKRGNKNQIYIDGILSQELTSTNLIGTSSLSIGRFRSSNSRYFNGQINDVRVFNHALTDMEIQEIARAKILHYTFDDFQEPTRNLLGPILAGYANWGTNTGTSVAFTSFEGTTGARLNITSFTDGGVRWYTTGNQRDCLPSTVYTVSAKIKYTNNPSGNLFYLRQYNSSGSQLSEGGLYNQINNEEYFNGYKIAKATFTTNSNAARFLIEGYQYSVNQIDIYDIQVEQKSYRTEFTPGTRSSTIRDNSGFFNDSEIVNLNGYGYKVDHIDQYGTWVKIFNHNSQNNANLFASDAEAAYNDPGNQNSNKFSILNQIPNFIRSDNKYKFKLQYPDVGLGIRNIWFQTSNPNTSLVSGYQAISIENSTNSWGGLERTNLSGGTTSTYIDGSVNISSWWFSIGQKVSFTGGNPGPGVTVNNTSLYMCIEDTKFIRDYPRWTSDSKIGTGGYIFNNSKFISTTVTRGQLSTEYTIAAWFKYTGTSANTYSPIIGSHDFGAGTEFFFGKNIGNNNFGVQDGNYRGDMVVASNVFDGNWHHFAFSFSSGTGKLYLDGSLASQNTFTGANSSELIYIGHETEGAGYFWIGSIDDTRFYTTVLSDKDILDLYNTKAEIEQSGILYAKDFLSNAEATVNLTNDPLFLSSAIPNSTASGTYGQWNFNTWQTDNHELVTSELIPSAKAIKVTANATGFNHFWNNGWRDNVPANTVHTISFYAKGNGSIAFAAQFGGGQTITLTENLKRYSFTYTKGATASQFAYISFDNLTTGQYAQLELFQCELKPYATPFISTFRPAIELPTGVQFGADEIHETGIANFEDFSTVGITDGLIGYWPFDGNMLDYSGNNYHGVNNGLIINSDHVKFDAQADNINFNNNSIFVPLEKTLIFTIRSNRPLSVQDNWEIGFLNQGTTPGSMFGMMYGVGECQDLGFWGYGASYDASVESVTNKWSSDGNWHHVVLTMNSSRQVRIYIDGQSKQWLLHSDYTTLADFLTLPTNTTNYFLANSRGVWNSGMTYVDLGEIKLFNRALTAEEIKIEYNTMFNNQVQIHESGVVYARDLEQY
jgi:hypothetical protein